MPKLGDQIAEKIFLKRPILGQILKKFGKETLFEYSKRYSDAKPANVLSERKKEFIDVLTKQTSPILGAECGQRLALQLAGHYIVSTADHLGPLNHPFFLNANMLAGLSQSDAAGRQMTDWIVLACANISLNNSSYPRGIQFHIRKGNELQLKSFPFFPTALRHAPVYNLPSYTIAGLEKLKNFLRTGLGGQVPKGNIEEILELYAHNDIMGLHHYSDQASLINYRMFKNFFSEDSGPLNLVYVNQEELTVNLLRRHLDARTEIHRLIFEPEFRAAALELFEGIPGAFSLMEFRGTFLFWGYDISKAIRMRLTELNGALVSDDGSFSVRIDPDSIYEALNQGTLIPSMLLNMLLVGGYYGLKCLGGFSQTSYLTWMLEAYQKMFPEARVGNSQTLCGDFIFADITMGGKQAFASTGLDLLLYKKKFSAEEFVKLCKTKTLGEVIARVMPILFKILYPNETEYHWPAESYRPDFSISPIHANPVIKL
jgi:hypothetical protein